MSFIVTTAYRLVQIADVENIKNILLDFCNTYEIKGTILLASEGININVTAIRSQLEKFYDFINSLPEFTNMDYKENDVEYIPFGKMKVKIKKEIIKFEVEDLDLSDRGEYLNASQWDDMIQNQKAMVIDTRNDYEVAFGTFETAINPNTRHFSELPKWLDKHLNDKDKETPIAMFCTGGVRCEKSTAYLKKLGFQKVYHLEGGIVKYLEDTKHRQNLWKGECFVFDDRIAVNKQLEPSIPNLS